MPDPTNIPHLLRLLDDDSLTVQEAVAEQFAWFGPELAGELGRVKPLPKEDDVRKIGQLIESYNRQWLRDNWHGWTQLPGDKQQLESALSLLATFQSGLAYPNELPRLLDDLADEYLASNREPNLFQLAHFLFQLKPLRGNRAHYDDPRNSNLVHCIEERTGIPISLCCIYVLVGYRLGLDIEGLNLPGHFLARASDERDIYIVDCFDGGRFLSERDLTALDPQVAKSVRSLAHRPPSAYAIIARVLRNLHKAYLKQDREENAMLMIDLLEKVENYTFHEP